MGLGAPGQRVETVKTEPRELPFRRSDAGIDAAKLECLKCEHFFHDDKGWMSCAACSCKQLDYKILVASTSCPLNKWGREERKEPVA